MIRLLYQNKFQKSSTLLKSFIFFLQKDLTSNFTIYNNRRKRTLQVKMTVLSIKKKDKGTLIFQVNYSSSLRFLPTRDKPAKASNPYPATENAAVSLPPVYGS